MENKQSDKLKYGRAFIILLFVITLGFSGTTLISSIVQDAETKRLILRGSRFLVTAVLCFGLLRGWNWARNTMIFFCFSGTLAAIVMIVRYGWETPRAIFSLCMAAIFLPLGILLLRSSAIRDYLAHRREQRTMGSSAA